MMERHDHNNPWADKLQDIRLPGQEVSWEAMEAVLDREMPVNKWKDGRRWLLLIILLLLLIGVCNCPGRRLAGDRENAGGRSERMSRQGTNRPEVAGDTVSGKIARNNMEEKVADGRVTEKTVTSDKVIRQKVMENRDSENKVTGDRVARKKATDNRERQQKVVKGTSTEKDGRENTDGGSGGTTGGGRLVTRNAGGEAPKTKGDAVAGKRGHRRKGEPDLVGDTALAGGRRLASGPAKLSGHDMPGGPDEVKGPGRKGHADTLSGPAGKPGGKRRNDSTATAARKPKADSILQMKGWLAGVGLNQFFIVGGQEKSNYNSNGTTGGISDYIPVPMVRYYFSRKLYVQLEAQFNAPQYTTKNLLANQSRDSASRPGQILQSSLFIKKLFYFNLPLSIHYSPIPNLYIGGGIQYARLTNGVALYQDSSRRIFTGVDSFVSAKIQSFRNDSTYKKLKTNEFRLMLDLNYNFKRFVIGARYNRALSDFINLRISNTQVTQSRNSSFQVYLRYIIWDGRKRLLLPK